MNIYHAIDQIDFVFDKGEQAYQEFVDGLCIHIKEFVPDLCSTLSDEELYVIIDFQVKRGRKYHLQLEEYYTLYVDACFVLGSYFDIDPQYYHLTQILGDKNLDISTRMENLYHALNTYLEQVQGDENQYLDENIKNLNNIMNDDVSLRSFEGNPISLIKICFPQKYEYVGKQVYEDFVREVALRGKKDYELNDPYALTFFVMILVTFGFRADIDPVYPWIRKSLRYDYPQNIRSLEAKSKAWVKSVVTQID